MINLIKRFQDILLLAFAGFFLAAIVGFYVWGLGVLGENLGAVTKVPKLEASATDFNFDLARRGLQARGLVPR
jgi:hypothetical protein